MPETLGSLIRRRMKELGIHSNAELARKTGLSGAYIGDLINDVAKTRSGTYNPSPAIVSSLSRHLHVGETEVLAAIGYNVDVQDRFEIDGITIQFDRSALCDRISASN